MAHRITIRARTPFLHFVVEGTNSPQSVRDYLAEAVSLCRTASAQHLVIEEHLTGESLRPADLFSIAQETMDTLPASLQRVAFVDTNPGHDPSLMRFVETIAVNRGVNVRVFQSVPAAALWLGSPRQDPPPTTD